VFPSRVPVPFVALARKRRVRCTSLRPAGERCSFAVSTVPPASLKPPTARIMTAGCGSFLRPAVGAVTAGSVRRASVPVQIPTVPGHRILMLTVPQRFTDSEMAASVARAGGEASAKANVA
jgi:hypothetical protein